MPVAVMQTVPDWVLDDAGVTIVIAADAAVETKTRMMRVFIGVCPALS
jgi:hypothetical protein